MMKRLICYLAGHRWDLMPYENAVDGWFHENHKCRRCGAHRRELVASRIG